MDFHGKFVPSGEVQYSTDTGGLARGCWSSPRGRALAASLRRAPSRSWSRAPVAMGAGRNAGTARAEGWPHRPSRLAALLRLSPMSRPSLHLAAVTARLAPRCAPRLSAAAVPVGGARETPRVAAQPPALPPDRLAFCNDGDHLAASRGGRAAVRRTCASFSPPPSLAALAPAAPAGRTGVAGAAVWVRCFRGGRAAGESPLSRPRRLASPPRSRGSYPSPVHAHPFPSPTPAPARQQACPPARLSLPLWLSTGAARASRSSLSASPPPLWCDGWRRPPCGTL